jgi:phosphatidylglycerophosphate synthase
VTAPGAGQAQQERAASTRDAAGAPDALARAQRQASLLPALLLPSAAVVGLTFATLVPLALAGPLALAWLLYALRAFGARHSTLPNLVTAVRAMLTGLLALAAREPWCTPRAAALLVLLIFVLDGVDGTLARSLGASSAQGAHFDLESDAYLVLTVCCLHVLAGHGLWVLTGGLLRYLYTLVGAVLPSRGEAPRSRPGRYVFAASLGCLTLGLVLPSALARVLAAAGTALLLASFGRSFWWALRG